MTRAHVIRSLGQMIRDEEMRNTMRILNARPERRPLSYAKRYAGLANGPSPASATRKPGRKTHSRERVFAVLAPAAAIAGLGVFVGPLAV